MTTTSTFDRAMAQVSAGEPLSASDMADLASAPDILPLGMLADAARRRVHGTQVTYVRVACCAFDRSFSGAVSPVAREVRITGVPPGIDVAVEAVRSARAAAGERTVSGFSWLDVERLAGHDAAAVSRALDHLRAAGLDALAEIPLDAVADPAGAVERLAGAGFAQLRLSIARAAAAERLPLLLAAAELQARCACIQAINPLSSVMSPLRPTTGYEDVKMVALARLCAPAIPNVQVDWSRYGPKLAQVALTFGADDLDAVSPSDEAPDGRRRAPLEEVRRNIEAAGFLPAERDGRFTVIA